MILGKKGTRIPGEEVRTTVAHVQDVASYILDKIGIMSAMKLQKLSYYSYGYHLAWEERPLFPERFQAWANGPVCPPLYALHRGRFQLSPRAISATDDGHLDEGERESIDLVLSVYGDFTAHQLSAMTHRGGPWAAARERAGAAPLDRSTEELSDEEIFEYFDALTSADASEQA